MRIALFDHVVSERNPAGSCDLRVLEALGDEHHLTVFASELARSQGDEAPFGFVGIPTIRRPSLVSFLLYLVGASVAYRLLRLKGVTFDVVQATDCSFPRANVCYAHFCHRAFLKEVWPRVRSRLTARTFHSWANHAVRALIESTLVRTANVIVVPSDGLRRDLERTYPGVGDKVRVIRNTVDLARFERPGGFDRRELRQHMRADESHAVFVFVALGHFERKGLPLLLHALSDEPRLANARLWVVGGEASLVSSYRAQTKRLGLDDQVTFAGRTDDIRSFLWSADAFVAPSHYEAFSLGLLEAAAAGLPLIATRISGSEELLAAGINGLEVEPTSTSVAAALVRFVELDASAREAMGRAARESVKPLSPERFAHQWRMLYASLRG